MANKKHSNQNSARARARANNFWRKQEELSGFVPVKSPFERGIYRESCHAAPGAAARKLAAEAEISNSRTPSSPLVYPGFAKGAPLFLYRHAARRTLDRRRIYRRRGVFHSYKYCHKIAASATSDSLPHLFSTSQCYYPGLSHAGLLKRTARSTVDRECSAHVCAPIFFSFTLEIKQSVFKHQLSE